MGKACSQCKQIKITDQFSKASHHKDGLMSACKECRNKNYMSRYRNDPERREKNKEYRRKNKEHIKKQRQKHNREIKEQLRERLKKYQLDKYEIIREQRRRFRKENKERLNIEQKKWRQDNNEIIKERKRNSYNPDKKRSYNKKNAEQQKEWRKKNKDKIKIISANWSKTKNGKECSIKKAAKRRGKKWIEIFGEGVNIFPTEIPVDYHHVDGNWFVAPLPSILHTGGKNIKQHIKQSNDWIEFYYGMNPTDFLKEYLT